MRLKHNYVLRQVADVWVVLPVDEETLNFNGMLTLNESGVLLWKELERGHTNKELVDALLREYNVNHEQASADVEEFLLKLNSVGCVEID